MTLKEIEALDTETLTCEQVGRVIGAKRQSIYLQAFECPEKLGFPVIIIGERVKIPKEAFLYFMKKGRPLAQATTLTGEQGKTIITNKGDNRQ